MTGSHTLFDHILLVMITLVWPVAEWRWYYPLSVRAIAAGVPGARARLYRNSVLPQWAFSACIFALWVSRGRPWAALMLGANRPARLGIAVALAALLLGVLWLQRRALFARPQWPELVIRSLGQANPLVPRTNGEYPGMILVALTAGVCEEILFRGYVTWYFLAFWPGTRISLALAVIISAILFGFGHIYFGVRQVGVSAVAGLFFSTIVLVAGSLAPAMILHAALDLNSFDVGYRALRQIGDAGADPAVPTLS
ncbi:MAG: CPBP family intramembrane glutamic endopeptidase [Candidatus Acidiferrales bacterium]